MAEDCAACRSGDHEGCTVRGCACFERTCRAAELADPDYQAGTSG